MVILQSRLQNHQIGESINIIKEYGELPQVECYAGLLNQVFMNILGNAIDTIQESLVSQHGLLPKGDAKSDSAALASHRASGGFPHDVTGVRLGVPEASPVRVISHPSWVRDKAKICIHTELTDDKQVIIRISDKGQEFQRVSKSNCLIHFLPLNPLVKELD